MKKLNQYVFKRKAAKYLYKSNRIKRWVDYKSAKTIILLFESDYTEKNRFIRSVIKTLNDDGKKVSAWGFVNNKKSKTAILPSFRILDRDSIDWFECPKNSFLRELADTEFDILIDLTLENILTLQYVSLYANAAVKTGMNRPGDNITDFQIIIPSPVNGQNNPDKESESDNDMFTDTKRQKEQQYLFEQITIYLKQIRSNDTVNTPPVPFVYG